ncbi:sigma-70 family RNA polymerase sigma factor [Streptomyces europaeiscabiei]|uniref:sigma-70 family RNA polymerase sigma factor n=1 Tax=Streptomyces europaeiscabiei TaxID=146819 RepID=UPI0029BED1D6|nr:sigma-70 family RNA polymerase sigma factor [Streptomyces europaeiscabiei]MDX3848491.1 sigma-70 family RNA polymerase sigma factor [Streptomyces europaeiscabiei]
MTAHADRPDRGPDATTSGPRAAPAYPTFGDFYARTQPQFVAYAHRYTHNREQALDAVQDAYTDVFTRWDTIHNPLAYTATAVRRNLYAQARFWDRTMPTSTPEATLDPHAAEPDPTETIDLKDELVDVIRQLPHTQRTIFIAYYLHSRTTIEIATALDITCGTVRAHLALARRRLRTLLTEPAATPAEHTPPTPAPPAEPRPRGLPLDAVYDRYAASIYRYVSLLTGAGPTAEEITSKTFRRVPLHVAANPETRLIATARAVVLDENDAIHRRHAVNALLAATEHEQAAGLRADALLEALNRLSTAQYECIVLRFLQGLTIADSARVMNRTTGALKLLQNRALKSLAHILEDQPQAADVSRALHAVAPRCSRYLTPSPTTRVRMRASIERRPDADTGLTR